MTSLLTGRGECQSERGSLAKVGLDVDPAPMPADDVFDDRQAETGAALLAARRCTDTIKSLRQARHESRETLYKLLNEERAVTADMAVRLSRAPGTSVTFWLNLQAQYDARHAERRTKVPPIAPLERLETITF
jgi:antitoxin HigA-1